jgi:hypothetical protein
VTVNVAVLVTASSAAVNFTDAWAVTFLWLMVNVALDLPAGIVTLGGQPAVAESVPASLTSNPPAGAGPVKAIVPVTSVDALPFTVAGEMLSD